MMKVFVEISFHFEYNRPMLQGQRNILAVNDARLQRNGVFVRASDFSQHTGNRNTASCCPTSRVAPVAHVDRASAF